MALPNAVSFQLPKDVTEDISQIIITISKAADNYDETFYNENLLLHFVNKKLVTYFIYSSLYISSEEWSGLSYEAQTSIWRDARAIERDCTYTYPTNFYGDLGNLIYGAGQINEATTPKTIQKTFNRRKLIV